jgi:hypothetical protein
LQRFSDLLGGEADAFGVIHRFEHVGDQLFDFGSDFFDASAFLAQDRVTVLNDWQFHFPSLPRLS